MNEEADVKEAEVTDNPYVGLRMLTVDDEPTFAETYRRYFVKRGFEVDVANTVDDFEKLLRSKHHHIVICDYYLDNDKVDGNRLMQLVEEIDKDAAVIVVTGRPSLDAAVASLRQKAADYLQKPIKIDDLAAAVDRALDQKGLLRLSANELQRKIGDKIREARKSAGLTLSQMAERTGLSVGFLSQIELERTVPRWKRSIALPAPWDLSREISSRSNANS